MYRRIFTICVLFVICIILSACFNTEHRESPSGAMLPTKDAAVTPTPEIEKEPEPQKIPAVKTESFHSPLYIPGLSVNDVITYFNEVCLDAEIVNGGNPFVVQKWAEPIVYIVHGTPTDEDISVLNSFTNRLNTIHGFPGISETSDPAEANLTIHFCSQQELIDILGNSFIGTDGGVTFWYTDGEIYSSVICCRADISQYIRNSVIQEELYNGLGPIQDTRLREDSIIFSGYSEPQIMTDIDELILKLLYHPLITCNMTSADCAKVIRLLYY